MKATLLLALFSVALAHVINLDYSHHHGDMGQPFDWRNLGSFVANGTTFVASRSATSTSLSVSNGTFTMALDVDAGMWMVVDHKVNLFALPTGLYAQPEGLPFESSICYYTPNITFSDWAATYVKTTSNTVNFQTDDPTKKLFYGNVADPFVCGYGSANAFVIRTTLDERNQLLAWNFFQPFQLTVGPFVIKSCVDGNYMVDKLQPGTPDASIWNLPVPCTNAGTLRPFSDFCNAHYPDGQATFFCN